MEKANVGLVVEFKFNVGEMVEVKDLGIQGLVDTAAVNQTGEKTYYIESKNKDQSRWWAESLLTKNE